MNNKRIFSLLLICLYSVFSFSQESKNENVSIEDRTQKRVERLSKKLKLSDDQNQQVYDLHLNRAQERKAIKEKMILERKTKDESYKLKMKSILTEQQYEQYLELRGASKMKRKHKNKRKPKKE